MPANKIYICSTFLKSEKGEIESRLSYGDFLMGQPMLRTLVVAQMEDGTGNKTRVLIEHRQLEHSHCNA